MVSPEVVSSELLARTLSMLNKLPTFAHQASVKSIWDFNGMLLVSLMKRFCWRSGGPVVVLGVGKLKSASENQNCSSSID